MDLEQTVQGSAFSALTLLVGWQEGNPAHRKWVDSGDGHRLVRMEWRAAGWLVCLPLLMFPCTIKFRSSLLAPAHLGSPRNRAVKRLCCVCTRHSYLRNDCTCVKIFTGAKYHD